MYTFQHAFKILTLSSEIFKSFKKLTKFVKVLLFVSFSVLLDVQHSTQKSNFEQGEGQQFHLNFAAKIKSPKTSGPANTGLLTEAMGPNDPHVTGPQQLQGRRQQSLAALTTISGCALITEGVPESSLLTREITGPLRLKAEGFVNLTPVPARLFFSLCRILRRWRDPSTKHRSLYSRIKHVKCNAAGVKVSIVDERDSGPNETRISHICVRHGNIC